MWTGLICCMLGLWIVNASKEHTTIFEDDKTRICSAKISTQRTKPNLTKMFHFKINRRVIDDYHEKIPIISNNELQDSKAKLLYSIESELYIKILTIKYKTIFNIFEKKILFFELIIKNMFMAYIGGKYFAIISIVLISLKYFQ